MNLDFASGSSSVYFTGIVVKMMRYQLRVVHTKAILFLKSMSEKGESDIERLRKRIS